MGYYIFINYIFCGVGFGMKKIKVLVAVIIVFILIFVFVFAAVLYKFYVEGKFIFFVKILESKGNVYVILVDFFKLKGFSFFYDLKFKFILVKKVKDIY